MWIGDINIPGNFGGDESVRYIFQVVEWNARDGCWIVSHAAHGDEQLCHLRLRPEETRAPDGTVTLGLSFSDAETRCEGLIDADGVIRGGVGQLVRPEEDFWQDATPENAFTLRVASCAAAAAATTTTNDRDRDRDRDAHAVRSRVRRLARWKIASAVLPEVFAAMETIKRDAGYAEAAARAAARLARETGLVDFVHLPTGFVEGVVQRAPGAPPWTPPESRTLETAENASEAPAPSRHPTDHPTDQQTDLLETHPVDVSDGSDADGSDADDSDGSSRPPSLVGSSDDDASTVPSLVASGDEDEDEDAGEDMDADGVGGRRERRARRRGDGFGVADEDEDADADADEGHGAAFRRMLRRVGNPDEVTWWRLWQTLQMSVEAECCAVRERAWRLRAAKFPTVAEKREAIREDARVGGTRLQVHDRAGALTRRQHALLWRFLNASALDASTASEGIRLSAMTLQQSEHRLRVAYHSFDEALRAFEARLPTDCVDRRCATIPPEGVRGVPGFEEKSAEETVCSICITPVETPGERLCLLDCGHAFHLPCVESWLHGNPSCPNCRCPVEADGDDDEDATPPEVAPGAQERSAANVAAGVADRVDAADAALAAAFAAGWPETSGEDSTVRTNVRRALEETVSRSADLEPWLHRFGLYGRPGIREILARLVEGHANNVGRPEAQAASFARHVEEMRASLASFPDLPADAEDSDDDWEEDDEYDDEYDDSEYDSEFGSGGSSVEEEDARNVMLL